ncbi:MAG: sugar phosphate isomerase/epimerase [Bacteroidaceae bacterium]|jgi:sugar phosphate isomerase/epimerase|nr:sugar phosphate isomerase/epimerase [Bacteroidaceae bacterium]MBQ2292145.1 sugar phosphate isomerase/epimerase [Bacteroidaceae bacterium]MBR0544328.1 sugar phosphate isomerase/epimerase [Bacteroidaceae bacterium]MEE1004449.1 sugar phosphate isomerase/epimerase [Bacteroidaceae bacterium]
MRRTLIFICLFGTLLSYSFGVEAKKKEIAFQMYSVRDLIGNPNKYAQNHESTLKALAKMGYTAIEAANYDNGKLYGVTPEQFKADIEAAGMEVLSSHVGHNLNNEELKSGNFDEALKWWAQCIDTHKRAGMKYIVNPGVNFPNTLAEADVICKYLNKVGEMVNAAGMKFGYHNHSYEFNKVEGQVWYDYMIKHTDADKVFYEMDVYWAVRGQVSPVEYFKKYPNRFTLLHIKDHKEFGESGMVGFDAIFNNADKAGLKHLVVELEASNRPNILDGMKVCADYLNAAKFVKATYNK